MGWLKFKEPQDEWKLAYEYRVTRLKKLIDMAAPAEIIGGEAKLVADCFTEDAPVV